MTPVTPDVCPPFVRRKTALGNQGSPPGQPCPECDTNGTGSSGSGACAFASRSKFPDLSDLAPQNMPFVPSTPCTVIFS